MKDIDDHEVELIDDGEKEMDDGEKETDDGEKQFIFWIQKTPQK